MLNGYRGVRGGSVQSAYHDQPNLAVPGMLAFASDMNLLDTVMVGSDVLAGMGVIGANPTDSTQLYQRPIFTISPPAGTETLASQLAGVVVFDEAMQSDENGNPGWSAQRAARILRVNRVGGRIYVNQRLPVEVGTSTVNWVIKGGAMQGVTHVAGEFSPVPGTETDGFYAGTITTSGSGYITAAGLATSGGSGSGCTVDITAVAGAITAVSVNDPGTGYAVGDVLTVVQGGGTGGTVTVTELTDVSLTIPIPNADWVASDTVGGLAVIEFNLATYAAES